MPVYRPSTVLDLDIVLACRVTEPISWVTPDRYQEELASGSYRPEWTWLAQDEGELVGRAVWCAPAGRELPVALDCLWVADYVADRTGVATALLQAGHPDLQDDGAEKPPDYEVDLDPRWRDAVFLQALARAASTTSPAATSPALARKRRPAMTSTSTSACPESAAGGASPTPRKGISSGSPSPRQRL